MRIAPSRTVLRWSLWGLLLVVALFGVTKWLSSGMLRVIFVLDEESLRVIRSGQAVSIRANFDGGPLPLWRWVYVARVKNRSVSLPKGFPDTYSFLIVHAITTEQGRVLRDNADIGPVDWDWTTQMSHTDQRIDVFRFFRTGTRVPR